jgi:hypothetical protein
LRGVYVVAAVLHVFVTAGEKFTLEETSSS